MVQQFTARMIATVALTMFAVFGLSAFGADEASWAIYVSRADGSGVRKVVRVDDYTAHGSPRWSHDGKRLCFDASGGPGDARKCFVVNLDGGGLREVGEHAMPDWSADDKQLIFTNYGDGGVTAGTWVQNLDGQGRTWMAAGICGRWSPDGSQIIYMDEPEKAVMRLDLVQGEEHVLYMGSYERIEPGFDWSPDGKRLAVIGANRNPNQRGLVIVSGSGTDAKQRLVEPKLAGSVGWSPDGKQLAVAINHPDLSAGRRRHEGAHTDCRPKRPEYRSGLVARRQVAGICQ